MHRSAVKIFAAAVLLTLVTASCVYTRIIRYNTSAIDDFKIFAKRKIEAAEHAHTFAKADKFNDELSFDRADFDYNSLDELLADNDTTAFLVLTGDKLRYEKYFNGYTRDSLSISFSAGKSVLSILIGCAIEDGYLGGVSEPVTRYVPELAANGFDAVTIEHLLQMTSGMDYTEVGRYNPLDLHSVFYYSEDLLPLLLDLKLEDPPGLRHEYKSGENELLALILTRALDGETISNYMQRRLWQPLGMEYDGYYCTDHEGGIEKTFCCLASTAVDLIKFGLLYLHHGEFKGQRIVPASWVAQSTRVDESNGSAWYYQYQWWLPDKTSGDFYAVGHLGQYIFIRPGSDAIVLRLGAGPGSLERKDWIALFRSVTDTP